jgi:GTP-binding protein Era
LREFAAIIPISAEREIDLAALTRAVAELLPEGPALYEEDTLTDRDERFLAAEFIREKIFRQSGEEVPYSTAVMIESFEHEGDLRRIRATVFVDKASQRAILLGKEGTRMKAIASQARAEMEELFGGRVFLDVWVRVKSGWSNSDAMLTRRGY